MSAQPSLRRVLRRAARSIGAMATGAVAGANVSVVAGAVGGAALAAGLSVALWSGLTSQAATAATEAPETIQSAVAAAAAAPPLQTTAAQTAMATPHVASHCAKQTWPYLSADCLKGAERRHVRLLTPHDAVPGATAAIPPRATAQYPGAKKAAAAAHATRSYSAVTVRHARKSARRNAYEYAAQEQALARRPLAISPGDNRALAYGEERPPARIVIVPNERNFGLR